MVRRIGACIGIGVTLIVVACNKSEGGGGQPSASTSASSTTPAATASSPAASDAAFCDHLKSKCPKDEPLGAKDIAECKKMVSDPKCGALVAASLKCMTEKAPCGPDGKAKMVFPGCEAEDKAAEDCQAAQGKGIAGGDDPLLAEAKTELQEIAKGMQSAWQKNHALCPSAKPVPATLDAFSGRSYQSAPKDWSDAGWKCASFSIDQVQHFQYEVQATSDAFKAIARRKLGADTQEVTLQGHVTPDKVLNVDQAPAVTTAKK